MEQWIDAEGGCWDGGDDEFFNLEEKDEFAKIYAKLIEESNERIENNELLEDWDDRTK